MDSVVLLDKSGRKHVVRLEAGMLKVEGLGVLDAAKLSSSIGKVVEISGTVRPRRPLRRGHLFFFV